MAELTVQEGATYQLVSVEFWRRVSSRRFQLHCTCVVALYDLFVCRSLVPALLEELRQAGMLHVLVVVGGIIPPQVG